MNRLVLLGNGFDRAHGLPTGYNEFLHWLFNTQLKEIAPVGGQSRNDYIEMEVRQPFSFPANGFDLKKFFRSLGGPLETRSEGLEEDYKFYVHIKQNFLVELLNNAADNDHDWSDIEKTYYNTLKKIVSDWSSKNRLRMKKKVGELNQTLEYVKEKLKQYLLSLSEPQTIVGYERIIGLGVSKTDDIMILSFNYTKTHKLYQWNGFADKGVNLINIHGDIYDAVRNPIIFGYGDEVDKYYRDLQDEDMNCILDNIKSIGYFKTDKYKSLSRFISRPFEVIVLGHSLGLSDRTLLHKIFNDDGCESIHIYHFSDGIKNNFTQLSQQITRHFYDTDFNKMRDKVVEFRVEDRMPQWNDLKS